MITISVLITSIILLLVWYNRSMKPWINTVNRIPGPKPNPLLGNLFENILTNPKKGLLNMRQYFNKYGPIVRFWSGYVLFIHVANADLAEVILTSKHHIRKTWTYRLLEPLIGQGLLTSYGERWFQKRKFLTPAFHFSILESFVDSFIQNSKIMIEKLEKEIDAEKLNIVPYFSDCTLDIICETAMGIEINAQKGSSVEYFNAVHRMNKLIADRAVNALQYFDLFHRLSENYREQKRVIKILHNMSKNVLQQRIKERQEKESSELIDADVNNSGKRKRLAFVDLLLDIGAHENVYSDMADIQEEVNTFLFEGHETTTSAITWTTFLIGCHPEVQEKIAVELTEVFGESDRPPTISDINGLHYLDSVLKESLRLYPPVPIIGRKPKSDIKFGDYIIPAGSQVVLHIHQIHRSSEYYENPDAFNPSNFLGEKSKTRNPFVFIPFSGGPRNCIGQKFAVLEAKIILSTLLRKFRVTSLEKEDEISVISDTVLRAENGIWVKLDKRN